MRLQRVGAGLVAAAGLLVAAFGGVDGTVPDDVAGQVADGGRAADDVQVADDVDVQVAGRVEERDRPSLAGRVVVVDPGHNSGQVGAEDEIAVPVELGGLRRPCNTIGGATEDGILEAAINWEVAQELARKLESLGAEVVLTREDDDSVGPCIDERVELATEVGADLALAIHADGWDEDDRGFHVAHAVGDLVVASPDVLDVSRRSAHVIRDHLLTARFVPSELAGSGGIAPRDDLGSLNAATVPSVVVEAGNLLHPEDAELLTSSAGQRRLASALAAAVLVVLAEPVG